MTLVLVPLVQGSAAWLRWRAGGLGGSDAPVVMGASPWKTPRQLWEVLTGRARAEESTFAMRRGLRLEPEGLRLYRERVGRVVRPACCVHPSRPWMRASLDGIDLWGELLVEQKWPCREDHETALAGGVPAKYVPQVQHQLCVAGCALAHYWSCSENRAFGDGERAVLVAVPPDPEYQARLVAAEEAFWDCVRRRVPPPEVKVAV